MPFHACWQESLKFKQLSSGQKEALPGQHRLPCELVIPLPQPFCFFIFGRTAWLVGFSSPTRAEPGLSAVRVWSPNHWFSSVQFSRSVVSDSLRLREVQHARPPCPSPTARVYPNRQGIPPPQPLDLLSPRPPLLPLADFSEAQTPFP